MLQETLAMLSGVSILGLLWVPAGSQPPHTSPRDLPRTGDPLLREDEEEEEEEEDEEWEDEEEEEWEGEEEEEEEEEDED